ncbi:IclR family transcriptional regulator domain-containing protein, partial [Salmonella enterica]|uniref:IclR family transcriptional regulator domain-containing protein n=1 Tax=Salmonella enterica TaxID=28901 RepID=UPI002666972B
HQAIIIDQVNSTQMMRMSAPIGGKLPMHDSGAGKAFLSQLSEEQDTSLLHRKGLHAYTHSTQVSPLHLKDDLAQTLKRG